MSENPKPNGPRKGIVLWFKSLFEGVFTSLVTSALVGLLTGFVTGFTATAFFQAVRTSVSYHQGWYDDCAEWLLIPVAIWFIYILQIRNRVGLVRAAWFMLPTAVFYPIIRTLVPLDSHWACTEFVIFHVLLAQMAGLLLAFIIVLVSWLRAGPN